MDSELQKHYAQLLGIGSPWKVKTVKLRLEQKKAEIELGWQWGAAAQCPECGRECSIHDCAPERTWRHLDTMQFTTLIRARTPGALSPRQNLGCAHGSLLTFVAKERFPNRRFDLPGNHRVHLRRCSIFGRAFPLGGSYRQLVKHGRFRAQSSLCFLFIVSLGSFAFASDGQLIRIPAGDLQLTLRSSASGISMDRLLDTRSGQELLATNPPSLFSITLRQAGSTNETRLAADAGWGQRGVEKHGKRVELRWSRPTDESLAGLSVAVTVAPDTAANALRWKLRVNNASTNWSVWRVMFPEVVLADLGTNAAVLFPRGPGEVQRGVWHRAFRFGGEYPSGWCSMQFLAAYRQGEPPTGLYVAMHDPWGSTKDLAMSSDPATHTLRLSYNHPAPDAGLAGNDFVPEGEAVWQLLRGDWFDAAMIYKRWASREAKWWPRLTREGRADTPRWMRDLNTWASRDELMVKETK